MSALPSPPVRAEAALRAPALRAVFERAAARWVVRLGSASRAELETRAERALAELDAAGLGSSSPEELAAEAERLCCELERAHDARYGQRALHAELCDERARDGARQNSAELVRYQAGWDARLARLQRAHPGRWRVPGLSDDEVRDAITLRLIELLVAGPGPELPPGRPGQPWALCVAQRHLANLRRSFRLAATPTSFDTTVVVERAPSQEERCLELEADERRASASANAERQLNRPQRRWLAAMQHAAAEGHFFHSSDELNLSAASRQLGKNRSSAQRAYRALEARFRRELGRLS
ncbi:MAG TPA: hypothetical protein VMG12_07925 [Polyangiaceae bacterium]|nr:hypothetical protein [Polyangiaceae bacterium]